MSDELKAIEERLDRGEYHTDDFHTLLAEVKRLRADKARGTQSEIVMPASELEEHKRAAIAARNLGLIDPARRMERLISALVSAQAEAQKRLWERDEFSMDLSERGEELKDLRTQLSTAQAENAKMRKAAKHAHTDAEGVVNFIRVGNFEAAEIHALSVLNALSPAAPVTQNEDNYPCKECGAPRTKAQGGTTFTVCDDCWNKAHSGDPR